MDQARLNAALVGRIHERLKDDWRRTGDGDWMRMPKAQRPKSKSPGLVAGLASLLLQRLADYEPPSPEPLKPVIPLTEKVVSKEEQRLGFMIPLALRQIYLEIGDGGFGPFNGIRRLTNWIKDYQKLLAEPIGEKKRAWPRELLPILYLNGPRICLNKDTGAVVRWTKPPSRCSEAKWTASFALQAESLEEWLENWVDTPTQAEGGPDGGWAPPAYEVERRERLITKHEASAATAIQKARTFAVAELPLLSAELLDRVRVRANDPARRTYMAGAVAGATPFSVENLIESVGQRAGPFVDDVMAQNAKMIQALGKAAPFASEFNMAWNADGGMSLMKSGSGGKLGAPTSEVAFDHATKRLGFILPEPLKQLYRIADGGFGPGDTGLFSIADLIERYLDLTSQPAGPENDPWPGKLLPLYDEDPAIGCLNLEDGKIVVYDPQRMDYDSSAQWRGAFVAEYGSLTELIENWLGEETFEERRLHGPPAA